MSKRAQPKGSEVARASRDARRRRVSAPELRVIQGGRAQGRRSDERGERTVARRSEQPARVRRRRRITVAVLAVLAVGLIVYVLLGPVTRVLESRRDVSRAQSQLEEEQSRTASLEERKAWDMTDAFVEWEARKMGYVKPGEIPIIVLDYHEEETATEGTGENTSENTPENASENTAESTAENTSP